jgi:hypothetical protein
MNPHGIYIHPPQNRYYGSSVHAKVKSIKRRKEGMKEYIMESQGSVAISYPRSRCLLE